MSKEGVRLFTDVLREIGHGQIVHDLSDDLHKLVEAVQETGKAGSLTLKLAVKPQSEADVTVSVGAEVKTTLPKPSRGASLFFVTDGHNLSRRDPRQGEMNLHEVGAGDTAGSA